MNAESHFRLGVIVNPLAGLGGAVALKGSDGVAQEALAKGAVFKSAKRMTLALSQLQSLPLEVITFPAEMGEESAKAAGFEPKVVGAIESGHTSSEDTEQAVRTLLSEGVDLLLFAGGDGTARNILDALERLNAVESLPVLGVPAGVKIHSGVYANTPEAAGEMIAMLIKGELVSMAHAEVRDIDEVAFRAGKVSARYYGELSVPEEHRFLQQVKQGGVESEELVLDDLAADFIEKMEPDVDYVMGSGSTVAAVMEALGFPNTLLGVDLIRQGELIAADCSAAELLELTAQSKSIVLVITLIGGQGHLFGRGNQQLSVELIRRAGRENIRVLATRTKLLALEGRPLWVDTDDTDLNRALAGVIEVHTGYHDSVLYRVVSS